MDHVTHIATELNLSTRQVEKTIELLDGGATIPFIARYRKEATGALNEVQIAAIRNMLVKLREIDSRREAVIKSIDEQGKLTDSLRRAIEAAHTMTEIEDLYLPYRPKRRTRAAIATERGLAPLAEQLLSCRQGDVDEWAKKFVNQTKQVNNVEEALAGARDIVAERIADDAPSRQRIRNIFARKASLSSTVVKGKEAEAAKFKSWFDWKEPAMRAPSHRILALFRGENEGLLRLKIQPEDNNECVEALNRSFVKGNSRAAEQVALAANDAYNRLIEPSIENEYHKLLKEKADIEAIRIFAENLHQLLLAPPLGQKRILALDPGFRTGCKLVCLDAQGQLLHYDTIYPFTSVREQHASIEKLELLAESFQIEAIAIGNGTAGRETEEIVRKCQFQRPIITVMVNESGASIYSASEVARAEFPDHDITVRGAVSIGRRLMDPLSELVKIDPKAIGVGQYQHDVNQTMLQQSLNDVVESCVNSVGVELNTASKELLSYVSGIGPTLASRIVAHRNANGPFASRQELLKVERMGAKSFEQCAGFLRVRDSKNPLDRSAVHPERYALVERMARQVGTSVEGLMVNKSLRDSIDLNDFVSPDCGLPTLQDIMKELDKPGLDPRASFEVFEFDKNVSSIEDIHEGMILPGIVTNITAFGAFVDIGVHQDGLVHISQMANRRIKDPNEVVSLHQQITVKVIEVDLERHRISLSMKNL